jgi:hypothetical protein
MKSVLPLTSEGTNVFVTVTPFNGANAVQVLAVIATDKITLNLENFIFESDLIDRFVLSCVVTFSNVETIYSIKTSAEQSQSSIGWRRSLSSTG